MIEFEYEVQGDLVTIDKDQKDLLNVLASRFYKRAGCDFDGDFSTSSHPKEQLMFAMALEAYYMNLQVGL